MSMNIKSNEKGRPKKRKKLIDERKKRIYIDEKGIKKSWTQKYLTEYIEKEYGFKISLHHIGEIERGKRNPGWKLLKALCEIFDMTVEEVMS